MHRIFLFFHSLPRKVVSRVLLGFGLLLFAGELYKQLFLYFFINGRTYDWWYFPFQLCSLPIYLCILQYFLPVCRKKSSAPQHMLSGEMHRSGTILFTFMQDFHMLGGIAALAVPDGFSGIHWTLTMHGYLWHIALILISLFLFLTGSTDNSRKGFLSTLPVFAVCCILATAINLLAPAESAADMFYISPRHASTQPVIRDLAPVIGIIPADLLYLTAVIAGGALIHWIFSILPSASGSAYNR